MSWPTDLKTDPKHPGIFRGEVPGGYALIRRVDEMNIMITLIVTVGDVTRKSQSPHIPVGQTVPWGKVQELAKEAAKAEVAAAKAARLGWAPAVISLQVGPHKMTYGRRVDLPANPTPEIQTATKEQQDA